MPDKENEVGLQERFEIIIRGYLKENFNNENALPGLVISGLAKKLMEFRWEIQYRTMEEDLEKDIEQYCNLKDVELTKEEIGKVKNKYNKLEDIRVTELSYIIDDIVNARKE